MNRELQIRIAIVLSLIAATIRLSGLGEASGFSSGFSLVLWIAAMTLVTVWSVTRLQERES